MTKAVRRKYNILATLYDRLWPGYIKKTIQTALDFPKLKGSEHILDIGCGTGELEKALLQKNLDPHVLGIDLSEDMLKKATEKLKDLSNIILKQGDFLKVDIPGGDFDVAYSISNLHYFRDPKAIFQKVALLLKKGGRFVLIDWNRDSFQGKIYNWYMGLADPGFAKIYTLEEVSELLHQVGLAVEISDFFKVGLRWKLMRIVSKKS